MNAGKGAALLAALGVLVLGIMAYSIGRGAHDKVVPRPSASVAVTVSPVILRYPDCGDALPPCINFDDVAAGSMKWVVVSPDGSTVAVTHRGSELIDGVKWHTVSLP